MDTIFFRSQTDLRKWFKKNHNTAKELWIGYYKKDSGKSGITYKESVDEALCFGWIDGIRKSIDPHTYKNRFTPRRKGSIWSAININRIKELMKSGLVEQAGLEAFNKLDPKKINSYSFEHEKIQLTGEYKKRLKSNIKAWQYFDNLPPSIKKPSIWYVISAKKEVTRKKRLDILIKCSEEGKKIPPLTLSRQK